MTEVYAVSIKPHRSGARLASCTCGKGGAIWQPNRWARDHVREHEAMIAFRAHRRERKAARR